MSDLRQLYQEVILDHNRSPRNFRKIESTCCHADGVNPLCGDEVTVYLQVEGDTIQDISFQGKGCAISVASASLMTEALRGKKVSDAETLFQQFHDALTIDDGKHDMQQLGKLAVLEGVKEYPARVKCATLAWHTSQAAIHRENKTITTERDDV